MQHFDNLSSQKKLDRDKGVVALQQFLLTSDPEDAVQIFDNLKELTTGGDKSKWEVQVGILLGIKVGISFFKSAKVFDNKENLDLIINTVKDNLKHEEVRVRNLSGDVAGCLCEHVGSFVFEKFRDFIFKLIEDNLERDILDPGSMSPEELKELDMLRRKLDGGSNNKTKEEIFHDTAGWKCLETSMKCLQAMVGKCGENFSCNVTLELLNLLFQALHHTNRFVRETGFYVLGSLVSCGLNDNGLVNPNSPFTKEKFGHNICDALALGLSDNWSQVRLASSEATRKFLLSFSTESEREPYYGVLIPRICLNRYYVADGVRIYSQETWRRIVLFEGRELVQKYINPVVDYYISQTKANNHAVREAACACIAELGTKINTDAVNPHVPKLLDTLIECFQDDSWPVRDAACLASGNFIRCFPNEAKSKMDSLYPLFFENLYDTIPSVRQGAAGALANVVKAYGDEAVKVIEPKMKQSFEKIKEQQPENEKYSGLSMKPGLFGVAKKIWDNDPNVHTNQIMYSCGSLAPKMGRSGCSSGHYFRKPTQPWERADGCVHLMSELCQLPAHAPKMVAFLDYLAEAANFKSYNQHYSFLETLCKQLPNIARGVRKRAFKSYLEKFLDNIFYSLNSENALTSNAASQCLNALAIYLGPSILRGRVELHNPSYLEQLEAIILIAGF